MIELQADPRGVLIRVRAHAGARRNANIGVRQGMLRVTVTAAPEKGKANRAITTLLSEAVGVPQSAIELVAGETSPQKRFLFLNADLEDLRRSLERSIS